MHCSIENCDSKHYGRGFCQKHYLRWWKTGDPLKSGNPTRGLPLDQRFWTKAAITANPDRCWEWGGRRLKGYGTFKIGSKQYYAHRVSYMLATGIIPTLDVLHSCDNPPCVNPNHLREGTHAENMQDKVLRNRTTRKETAK